MDQLWGTYLNLPEDQVVIMYVLAYVTRALTNCQKITVVYWALPIPKRY